MDWHRRQVQRKEWLYVLAAVNAGSALAALGGMLGYPSNASLANSWWQLVALALIGFVLSWPMLPIGMVLSLGAMREALAHSRECCVGCGYALGGLIARCPECGTAVPPGKPAVHRPFSQVPLPVLVVGVWTVLSGMAAVITTLYLVVRLFTLF